MILLTGCRRNVPHFADIKEVISKFRKEGPNLTFPTTGGHGLKMAWSEVTSEKPPGPPAASKQTNPTPQTVYLIDTPPFPPANKSCSTWPTHAAVTISALRAVKIVVGYRCRCMTSGTTSTRWCPFLDVRISWRYQGSVSGTLLSVAQSTSRRAVGIGYKSRIGRKWSRLSRTQRGK